jgi:hypothetical protein
LPERSIVRRVAAQTPAPARDDDLLPARIHRAGGIFVSSQLSLGIDPRLFLSWAVLPRYWAAGHTLLVFRSTSGFCAERHPDDLNRHGALIVETAADDRHEERLAEGTYYYTFVLHKNCLLGLAEKVSVLRFSETIPSAKVAVGRIKDRIDLQDMLQRHELDEIEHEAKLNEAKVRRIQSRQSLEASETAASEKRQRRGADDVITKELADIDVRIEAAVARIEKIEELKRDPKFLRLSRREQREIVRRIEERLDAAEVSARREMRGR